MATSQTIDSGEIWRKGTVNMLRIFILTGGVLFLSAGRADWLQPWLLMALYAVYFAIWIPWGLRHAPELIAERAQGLSKQEYAWDRLVIRAYFLALTSTYVVAGLDSVRYGWTHVPSWLIWVGAVLVLGSFALTLLALMNNPYASGVVRLQKERGQQVADRGPYHFVRHPMYTGTLLFGSGAPLFLGSYWALIPGLIMAAIFVVRTALEDKILQAELPGYADYAQRVRYRLVPGIW